MRNVLFKISCMILFLLVNMNINIALATESEKNIKNMKVEKSVTCTVLKLKTQNKNILLPDIAQIYFVHNISQKSLWLDHPAEHKGKGVSAGWSSYFQPGKWSAILLNRKNFAISCAVIQPGKVDYQDCAKVISVCQPEKISFESNRKGSYWLVEDKTWDELLSALGKRGVQKNTEKNIKEKMHD